MIFIMVGKDNVTENKKVPLRRDSIFLTAMHEIPTSTYFN